MNILKKLQRICVDKQFEERQIQREKTQQQEYQNKGIHEEFERYIKEESENNLNQKLPVLWSYDFQYVQLCISPFWRTKYPYEHMDIRKVDIMWIYSPEEKKYKITKKEDIETHEMLDIIESYIVKLNNEQEKLWKKVFNKLVKDYKKKNWKLDMFLELNDQSISLTYRGIRGRIYFKDLEKEITTIMKKVEKFKKEINLKYFKWEE